MLPADVAACLEDALSVQVTRATPVSGGMVSRAARVETADGTPLFVKWKPDAAPGLFAAEANGLALLASAEALRVPQPLAWGDEPPFLALEWIGVAEPRDVRAFSRRFAEGLAALHRVGSPEGYGLDKDNWLGSQPQPNLPRTTDWAAFYRDRRLVPQIERARREGFMTPHREELLARLLDRLPELLIGMPPGASLIHGDLWSGNFLCAAAGDEPVLIDPAAYFAPREMELAYVELFGGFPPGFVTDYHAAYPLDEGYAYRRPLHQLYPLLIHLNHFGEQYGPAVERACAVALTACQR
jgi:fructosamine-3-kinase